MMETKQRSKRIAAIDWMRGFVMILMVIDHVSMAYNAQHDSSDSAALYVSGTPLPAFEFFTHLHIVDFRLESAAI